MTPMAEVADHILARPAPVLIVDSCNFLDLLRVVRPTKDTAERRVETDELKAAVHLLNIFTTSTPVLHHVVPELVPGEFADNAGKVVAPAFQSWLKALDDNYQWLASATAELDVAVHAPPSVSVPDLSYHLRTLAEQLLATATVLDRDRDCLDRAVGRLLAKRRPSHKKEIKDSMNLEQAFELCRRLAESGPFPHPLCFVSANTKDFAESSESSRLHVALKTEFDRVSLQYFTSFRAVLGHLLSTKMYPI